MKWSWHIEHHPNYHRLHSKYFHYSYHNIIIGDGKNIISKYKNEFIFWKKKIIMSMWKLTLGYDMQNMNWIKNVNKKHFKKKKVTLCSSKYSISLGEDLNWHMFYPILATLSWFFWQVMHFHKSWRFFQEYCNNILGIFSQK